MDRFMTPQNMGLMGLAAGLLQSSGASPREVTLGEGFGNGMQQGMQGMQQGMQMQLQKQHMGILEQEALAKQEKLKNSLQTKNLLEQTLAKQQSSGDMSPVSIGNALIATNHPDLMMQGMGILKDFRSKVKTTAKGLDEKGNPVIYNVMDSGETSSTGITPAEKLMQINQGSQIGLANPYTGQIQSAVGVGMSPGEGARLAQSERQFGASHGLAQQNARRQAQELQMKYDPAYQAQMAAAKAGGTQSGKLNAEGMDKLPQTLGVLAESLNLSDDLKNHPALNNMVGSLPVRTLGQAKAIYGGNDEADFTAKMEQAQGKQFLSAIDAMRGFGALTEVEGAKMQSSAAAMSTAQNPNDFKKAQDDYQAALVSGTRKVASRLGIPESEVMGMLNKERGALRKRSGSAGGAIGSSGDSGGYSVRRLD